MPVSTRSSARSKRVTPLEESLSLYTEGAELIRTCTKQLDEAEQTVVKLQKGADGAPVETSFVSENE